MDGPSVLGGGGWRLCGQGGLFVGGVWLVCRLVPRLPAAARAWLWWLACAKLLLSLLWTSPVLLPVLTAPAAPVLVHAASSGRVGPAAHTRGGAAETPVPRTPEGPAGHAARPAPPSPPRKIGWPFVVATVWLLGVLAGSVRAGRQVAAVRRALRRAAPQLEASRAARATATRLGLRRCPPVVSLAGTHTPFVAGALRPVIALPEHFSATFTPEELRLAVAHELAHVRRGDLWLGLLPAVTQTVLFFFPPAWQAAREYAAACEEACDALAVRATGVSAGTCGRLLLKIGTAVMPGAAAMASRGPGLKRRLLALGQGTMPVWARPIAVLALGLGLTCLVPWRLTARTRPETQALAGPSPTRYRVVDLGLLDGRETIAYDLNDAGQVVGSAGSDLAARAFLWQDGALSDLGPATRRRYSRALGINNVGQVVTASYRAFDRNHPFVWQEGRQTALSTLPGFRYGKALGVNDLGQAVGYAETGEHDSQRAHVARAVLWGADGQVNDLGTLGGPYSVATSVNSAGQVVGKADLAADASGPPQTHAFLWQSGQMTDLGTLGGANSLATRINAAGQVVGFAETDTAAHAFVWQNGQMRDLGTLPGGDSSAAQGINDRGEVVGTADVASPGQAPHAFLWQDGVMVDLNHRLPAASGWLLTEARAINHRGQIAGRGLLHGQAHAFLLTPVTPGR